MGSANLQQDWQNLHGFYGFLPPLVFLYTENLNLNNIITTQNYTKLQCNLYLFLIN